MVFEKLASRRHTGELPRVHFGSRTAAVIASAVVTQNVVGVTVVHGARDGLADFSTKYSVRKDILVQNIQSVLIFQYKLFSQ
jgi:hypothetical protein